MPSEAGKCGGGGSDCGGGGASGGYTGPSGGAGGSSQRRVQVTAKILFGSVSAIASMRSAEKNARGRRHAALAAGMCRAAPEAEASVASGASEASGASGGGNRSASARRTRGFERAAVVRAADFGLERMRVLLEEFEPRLYRRGAVLGHGAPGRYLAAFNAQGEQERRLAQFGYAALQATSMLVRGEGAELDEDGEADGEELELRRRGGRGWQRARIPRVSLRHTALGRQCPSPAAPRPCPSARARFRSFDGRCNSHAHPERGAAGTPLRRLLPAHYKDGLEKPREAASGGPLPSARDISAAVHGARDVDLAAVTHFLMQWGQIVDHDLTASAQTRGFNSSVPKCCTDDGSAEMPPDLQHPDCMPMAVSRGDRFLGAHGVRCLEFVRSGAAPRPGCALGPRDQLNRVTAFLDASAVYGSSAQEARRLRLRRGGLLRYRRVQGRLPLLPVAAHGRVDLCHEGTHAHAHAHADAHAGCFDAGDGRVNEQPGLIAAHALLLRLHNRVATRLAHLNAHWDDERLFQEARRVVAAALQHVTYREFLPLVLGPEVVKSFGLELTRRGFFEGYDERVNPAVANAFATAAFRFGHSLVQGSLLRCDRGHRPLPANVSLHEELTKPNYLHHVGSVDKLLLGMCAQPAQKRDEFITEQLTNHLFQTPNLKWGLDLAAINIQRGRDHGLAPYNTWREACGLQPFTNWVQMLKVMTPETQRKLKRIYRDIDDIDLFPGAMAEKPVNGGLVGPTFACILAQQFSNLRKGDRFWYENGGFESSFTPAQLQQIRKITLARILCDNLDSIDTIQPFVFLTADNDRNQYTPCEKIMNFDFTPWTEHRIVNEQDSYNPQDNHGHGSHHTGTEKYPPYHHHQEHDTYHPTEKPYYQKPASHIHYEYTTTPHPPYHHHQEHDNYHPTEKPYYQKPASHIHYEYTTTPHQPSEYHQPPANDYEKPILLPAEHESGTHYDSYNTHAPHYPPKPQNNYSVTYIYEFELEHKPKPSVIPSPNYSKPQVTISPTPSYSAIHLHQTAGHHSHNPSDSYHSTDSKPHHETYVHSKPHHQGDSYLSDHSHIDDSGNYHFPSDSYFPPKPTDKYTTSKPIILRPPDKPYYPLDEEERPPSVDNYGPDANFPTDSYKPPDVYNPIQTNNHHYHFPKPMTDSYHPHDNYALKPPVNHGSVSYLNKPRPQETLSFGQNKPVYYETPKPPKESYQSQKPSIGTYEPPMPDNYHHKPTLLQTPIEVDYPKPEIIYTNQKPPSHGFDSSNTNSHLRPLKPIKGSTEYTVIEVSSNKGTTHISQTATVATYHHNRNQPASHHHVHYGSASSSHHSPTSKPPPNYESGKTPVISTSQSSKSPATSTFKGNHEIKKNHPVIETSNTGVEPAKIVQHNPIRISSYQPQNHGNIKGGNVDNHNKRFNDTNNENSDVTKYVLFDTSPELPTPGIGGERSHGAHLRIDESGKWSFDIKETDDLEELPDVPHLPNDPEAVRELPHPITEEDEEEIYEEDEFDSRTL